MEQKTRLKTRNKKFLQLAWLTEHYSQVTEVGHMADSKILMEKMKARLFEYELDRPSLHNTAESDSNFDWFDSH